LTSIYLCCQVKIGQAIVHGQREQAQVANRDRNELQETLRGLHELISQNIRESGRNRAPQNHNAVVALTSVEQVGLLLLSEIIS
jgi:hypothetical protein